MSILRDKKEEISNTYWDKVRRRNRVASQQRQRKDRLAFSKHNMFRKPITKLKSPTNVQEKVKRTIKIIN